MVVAAILALSLATGCPDDEDDCSVDPSLCDGGDPDSDAGTDADADPDATETGDDADTAEVANCPSVAGNWALTYRNGSIEDPFALTLVQVGCSLTGFDDGEGEYSGTIHEDGSISLQRIYGTTRTLTGNLVDPSQLVGNWISTGGGSGDWWANRQ